MLKAVRELLLAEGITGEALAALEAKYPSRKRSRVIVPCPACGCRPGRYDYVCGECSAIKAEHPRRFWQYVREREGGGKGRLKD